MKRIITAILLCIALLLSFAACGGNPAEKTTAPETNLAPVTFKLIITLPDGTQKTHDITTEFETLGEALDGQRLIERDEKGMIIAVDGIEADYEKDQAYWAFYIGGEFAVHGADEEILANGNEYEFRYTKG